MMDDGRITELDLVNRRREIENEKGSLAAQLLVTVGVSAGAATFGIIVAWAGGALSHLEKLEYDVYRPTADYTWLVCYASLGAAVGVVPWAFLATKMGPRATLILQGPCLLICWFLKAYYNHYKIYLTVQFFSGFFGVCYMFTGEAYLIETVHRYYMKSLFTCFRASFILGVVLIGTLGPVCSKLSLCVVGAAMTATACGIMCALPESPAFLVPRSEPKAEKSLQFLLGKKYVSQELSVIRRFTVFLINGPYNRTHLLTVRAVRKSTFIVVILQIVGTTTGYYAFLLDSVRIFTKVSGTLNPSMDNLIYGSVLFLSRLIATKINLRVPFGVKKPMLLSTFLISVVLVGTGLAYFVKLQKTGSSNCIMLLALCLYSLAYEIGIGICTEMVLYDYSPYQVYDYLMKTMLALHWALVCVGVVVYMACQHYLGMHWTVWFMSIISTAGFVFIIVFVVESKGKTLTNIQYELGGNPAGNRGSTRQRMPSPFEQDNDHNSLQALIRAHIPA